MLRILLIALIAALAVDYFMYESRYTRAAADYIERLSRDANYAVNDFFRGRR